MFTPRSASFSAMPRPIPRELPVTSARFPWSGIPTSFLIMFSDKAHLGPNAAFSGRRASDASLRSVVAGSSTSLLETPPSSRNHCERSLIANNADVPLAGGCVLHSQHISGPEVPGLVVRRGYRHDSLEEDNELSRRRRVKRASLQVMRAPARIEPCQYRAGSRIGLGKHGLRGRRRIDLAEIDGDGLKVRVVIRCAIKATVTEPR